MIKIHRILTPATFGKILQERDKPKQEAARAQAEAQLRVSLPVDCNLFPEDQETQRDGKVNVCVSCRAGDKIATQEYGLVRHMRPNIKNKI